MFETCGHVTFVAESAVVAVTCDPTTGDLPNSSFYTILEYNSMLFFQFYTWEVYYEKSM